VAGRSRARLTRARRVGLISDTHGLLRPEALELLRGADHIVHGGDIGDPAILEALRAIAPVTAVRGNNDRGAWARRLAVAETVKIDKVVIAVVHELKDLKVAGCRVVVSGHSHKPKIEERDGVLYVNPGSAGPRRFALPVALGELTISGSSVRARIKEIL
jgi:putative phosphoesterase